jgi:mannose-1-phosphate guanylyltransferase
MKIESPLLMHQDDGSVKQVEQANRWAIVLAAGDGTRLRPITRMLYGHDLPKQFAALNSDRTLLQQTMDRLRPLARAEHTLVVVAEDRESLAKAQLAEFAGVQVVSQPRNLGTGPGVLLPLSVIKAHSPHAMVIVTPSDHVIPSTSSFLFAARRALSAARHAPSGLAVVGAEADRPAPDLGWVVPRGPGNGGAPDVDWVEVFVEKPSIGIAKDLLGRGGLWNTLIVAGSVESFWRQAQRHMPHQTMLFTSYAEVLAQVDLTAEQDRTLLDQIYQSIPAADFSRAVLQKARGMAVVKMKGSGWSDCGTPERLLTSLARATHLRPQWIAEVRRAVQSHLASPLYLDHGA